MRLLDLFCGAGGAGMGYHRAGFEVVGVDHKPQPRYPFEFLQGDALEFLEAHGHEFDVIHTSPPCQAFTRLRNTGTVRDAPDLIDDVRRLLIVTGKPYLIENVQGAPLENPLMLCGASFGLSVAGFDLNRHRYFESNVLFLGLPCQHTRGRTIGVYGNGTNSYHYEKFGRCVRVDELRTAMGIDWMTRAELSQAIPPAYTEWLGRQILEQIMGTIR